MDQYINYIPVLTTVIAIYFTWEIFRHYLDRKTAYLFWWTLGVLTFGLGTLAESIQAFAGWSEANLKYWYITGALLGGFPLAQGSVYLLTNRKFANVTTVLMVSIIITAGILVVSTPLSLPDNFDEQLSGSVFAWEWVRYFSPLINIYSFIFLVGGAIYSAVRYYGLKDRRVQFKGNIFIAIGGLLPGIGGTFARMGHVEVLFVTELIGLSFIYAGYKVIKEAKHRHARHHHEHGTVNQIQ